MMKIPSFVDVTRSAHRAAARFVRPGGCLAPVASALVLMMVGALESRAGQGGDGALPLEAMITGDGVWTRNADQFEEAFGGHRLQWLSEQRDRARFFGGHLAMWDGALKPIEINVDFREGFPASMEILLYTRADSEERFENEAAFEARAREWKEQLEGLLGLQGTEREADRSAVVSSSGWIFRGTDTAYLLEYSFQRERRTRDQEFRPEFIRLRVASLQGSDTGERARPVARDSLSERVVRESNGDVFLRDVPMVDQGPRGYCAVATTERVLRYYGLEVDQHELAQMADSEALTGTDGVRMMEELRSRQGRLRLRVRDLMVPDVREYQSLVRDYNRLARRNDARMLDDGSRVIDVAGIFTMADPDILLQARTERDRTSFGRFERTIQGYIDRGVPVIWSVMLGVFPEADIPQASGGHMRMIIGYNEETREIIFSDSWGADHAFKRMPIDRAWTITTGIWMMEPIGI